MRYLKFPRTAVFVSFAGLWLAVPSVLGQDDLTTLLTRLDAKPFDPSALFAIEGHSADGRIVPALGVAFNRREIKQEKQWIAVTLLRLGDNSEKYFDFLAGYAREAMGDRTPYFAAYDTKGSAVPGRFSSAFENWCAQNGKYPRSVAEIQLSVYPEDVLFLARSQDQRGAKLLRMGLDSPNPAVMAFAVQGLGRLQDVAAIPLIAKASEGLPNEASAAIAMQLPWFTLPEADNLMEVLMPDREQRDFYAAWVRRARLAEPKFVQSRQGAPAQK